MEQEHADLIAKIVSVYYPQLLRAAFHGFSFWSFVWVWGTYRGWKTHRLDKVDRVLVWVLIFFGMVYLINMVYVILTWDFMPSQKNYWLDQMYFGKYWLAFWIFPFTIILLPIVLLIQKIRTLRILRIIIALWILIVFHITEIIILITDMQAPF